MGIFENCGLSIVIIQIYLLIGCSVSLCYSHRRLTFVYQFKIFKQVLLQFESDCLEFNNH